ncbi:hypothetical protein ABKA04_008478 [Annulohypoxylon sp. FPYF3050]
MPQSSNQGQGERQFVWDTSKPPTKKDDYGVKGGKEMSRYLPGQANPPPGWSDRPFVWTEDLQKNNSQGKNENIIDIKEKEALKHTQVRVNKRLQLHGHDFIHSATPLLLELSVAYKPPYLLPKTRTEARDPTLRATTGPISPPVQDKLPYRDVEAPRPLLDVPRRCPGG